MKQYRFDYIEGWVEQWNPCVSRTVEKIKALPLVIHPPFITLDENSELVVIPAMDYYGEEIDDLNEWRKQRDDYIKNLSNKYKGKL